MTDALRELVAADAGLAVVSTTRTDGSIRSSVVNAGLLPHPVGSGVVAAFVARGDAAKLRDLRRRPRATLVWRAGWRWASVEGPTDLVGPDDPAAGVDGERLRLLLREVFEAAGGTHEDFAAYDRVMADERRCVVLVGLDRVLGVPPPA